MTRQNLEQWPGRLVQDPFGWPSQSTLTLLQMLIQCASPDIVQTACGSTLHYQFRAGTLSLKIIKYVSIFLPPVQGCTDQRYCCLLSKISQQSADQLTEVHSSWRQTQWSGWCGKGHVSPHFLWNARQLVVWILWQGIVPFGCSANHDVAKAQQLKGWWQCYRVYLGYWLVMCAFFFL